MPWFIYTLNAFELMACIVGFMYWQKIRDAYWKWFPVYLGVIVLIEMTGEYMLHVKKDLSANIAIYSFFGIPLQFFFLYWLFYQQFKKTSNSNWPLISAVIYLAALITDLSYISGIEFYFESFSYTIGCTLLLALLFIYFFRFIKSDEIIGYKNNMMFWVSIGVLAFYIGTMPFYAFRKKLYVEFENFFYIYWYIQFGLNYLMYLFFIFSFIWGKPK